MLAATSCEQSFRKPKFLQRGFHESWKASKIIEHHCTVAFFQSFSAIFVLLGRRMQSARNWQRSRQCKTLGLAAWPCDAFCVVHLFHPKCELSHHQKLHSPGRESLSFRALQWLSSFSVICQFVFMENAWTCRTCTNVHLESAYRIEHKSEFQPGSQEASRKVSQRLDTGKENLQMVQNRTLKPIPWRSDNFLNNISCVFGYFGTEGIAERER